VLGRTVFWRAHLTRGLPRSIAIAFALVITGAVFRIVGAWLPVAMYVPVMIGAGPLWTLGFAIYTVTYAPALLSPRVDGHPG
jgi:uncharacterized protein involved in response to NO